jgi:hypothetical protein
MLASDYYRGDSDFGFGMGRQRIDVEAVNGPLLISNITENQSELISIRVDSEGLPSVRDVIVLERYEYPEEVWEENNRYVRAAFVSVIDSESCRRNLMPIWVCEVGFPS